MTEPGCNGRVLATSNSQLTGESRTGILASAIIYVNRQNEAAKPQTASRPVVRKPMSNTDYIAYKKAQVLAFSKPEPRILPQQTIIITELQTLGSAECPNKV